MTTLTHSVGTLGGRSLTHLMQNPFHDVLPRNYKFSTWKRSSQYFAQAEEALRGNWEPHYGKMEKTIEKIIERSDRKCELLTSNNVLLGLIVFKKQPQSKFDRFGLSNGFEVKTFMVIDHKNNTEKIIEEKLLARIIQLSKRAFAACIYIVVTNQDVTIFLQEKGFGISKTWEDKNEQLLSYKSPEKGSSLIRTIRSSEAVEGKSGELTIAKKKRKRSSEEEAPKKSESEKKEEQARNGRGVAPDSSKRAKCLDSKPTESKRTTEHTFSDDQYRSDRNNSYHNYSSGQYGRGYDHHSESSESNGSYRGNNRRSSQYNSYGTSFSSRYDTGSRQHEITLKRKYIHQIKSGGKTIEGRINNGMILRFKTGDNVRFFYKQNERDDARCKIEDIRKYKSFKELLESEGYENCLTDVRSLNEAVRIYDKIPSYSQRAAKFGVVAIQLSLLSK